ncbi:MAG: hypothetical protein ACKVQA_06655 [Burkholderiales bacterium]
MKTTIDIPDPVFRKAKSQAAERGQSLKDFVTEALTDKLTSTQRSVASSQPGWMSGFGKLKRLRRETAKIQARIAGTFEVIEPEDKL